MRPALILISAIILFCSSTGVSQTYDAVAVNLSMLQKQSEEADAVTVETDSAEIPIGSVVSVQMGNIVCDLSILERNEDNISLRVEAVTAGPNSKQFFGTYRVPFDVPIILDSIITRDRSFYRLSMTATGVVTRDTTCFHNIADPDGFSSDPSPHFQIFFVPRSLADFQWNSVRSYLESEYDTTEAIFDFDDHLPVNLYLMPCNDMDIHYDPYYGFSIDPVRNNVMYLYSHTDNTLSYLAVNMMKFYRFWGFAPVPLVEAAASFSDFNDYWVIRMKKSDDLPVIEDYFLTSEYVAAPDREVVRQILGSFFGYLIKSGDVRRFKSLYQCATDLTLSEDIESIYGKSTDELVSGWHAYLDTVTIVPGMLRYQAHRVAYQKNYDQSIFYLNEVEKMTGGSPDLYADLSNFYYASGRYKEAEDYYRLKLDTKENPTAKDLQTYANFMLINGRLDDARRTYEKVIDLDSTLYFSYYKLGRIIEREDGLGKALPYYRKAANIESDDIIRIDAQIAIGRAKFALGDPDSAEAYLGSALNGAKMFLMSNEPQPLAALRAGEAFLYLNQTTQAIEQLEYCIFVESRPFYTGRAALALGKAYDLRRERDRAIEAYKLVKTAPGGYLFVEEAEKLLNTPFKLHEN